VAGSEEHYDEPAGSALEALWRERAADDGAWVTRPADTAAIRASGLFEDPVSHQFRQRQARPAEAVVGLESTRATSLSWPGDELRDFQAQLRRVLGPGDVGLTLESSVTLARVAG
jgi:hypothetical protein